MNNLSKKTIREIALEIPLTTKVFEEYKIDYCCGGNKTLSEACIKASVSPKIIVEKINQLAINQETTDFVELKFESLSQLVNYISEKHHTFTREEITHLTPLMAKVAKRHGENHSELFKLERVFNLLCDELLQHLLKEEQILFPYIEQLELSINTTNSLPNSFFGKIIDPVKILSIEHDNAGEHLRSMREITNDFNLPEDTCASYSALFERLEGFELDLHQHIHVENNLLFPKAIELEEKVS